MPDLEQRFSGSLLGAVVGDVVGAVVEAESPGYIRKAYRSIDEILAQETVPEPFGGFWQVGRYTDDSQMTLGVAEWLVSEDQTPEGLLERFVSRFEPWRRYGPSTSQILSSFRRDPSTWRRLSETLFPGGSYGNGSAMRAAPIGLRFHRDLSKLLEMSELASVVTHAHPLAIQGATLQAFAVATAVRLEGDLEAERFLALLRGCLSRFSDRFDTEAFGGKLDAIESLLTGGADGLEAAEKLGTDIEVDASVPFALFCALRHPQSYEETLREAVFAGGDTDTIAAMAGAISGAALGVDAVPTRWVERIDEATDGAARMRELARQLARLASLEAPG